MTPGYFASSSSPSSPKEAGAGTPVSTLLTVLSLEHALSRNLIKQSELKTTRLAIQLGLRFIDQLYVHAGEGSYNGCLMDGKYWDTLLVANALLQAGEPEENLTKTRMQIRRLEQKSGGYPYGLDFEYAPDVDDTSEAILFLHSFSDPGKKSDRARLLRAQKIFASSAKQRRGMGSL